MNRARQSVLAAALLLAGIGSAPAAPSIALPPGGSVALTVPPASFTHDVYVDVPEGAERLTVRLVAGDATQDVDLLVRFGSPFPESTPEGLRPDANWLFEHGQYLSTSAAGDESIVITRAGRQPLRAGRLYLSVINFAGQPAPATLSATLGAASDFVPISVRFDDPGSVDDPCDISGWNDTTAVAPVGGNNGTTRGQQRRNAMLEAARLLSNEIRPNTEIVIRACWKTLASASTLAQAGPENFQLADVIDPNRILRTDMRYLARPYTLYSQAAAAHQAGTRSCSFSGAACNAQDVNITFNTTVDQNTVNTRRFDYSFGATSTGSSFISVAMHEITHGLGFVGLVNYGTTGGTLGAKLIDYDDIYGSYARITPPLAGDAAFLRVSDGERAAALTGGDSLRFAGPDAMTSLFNLFSGFAAPTRYVPLHAPATLAPGSTYSHVNPSSGGQLMQANINGVPRSLDLALDMLRDLGWTAGSKAPPAELLPVDGQYYDISRSGHGFDFRRVAGSDLYFMVYYSFDANGNPEWYNAVGRVVDGVFVPARNQFGDNLLNNLFRPGQNPQTVVDDSAAFNGQVRIDFASAAAHPSCHAALPGRPQDDSLNVMTWLLGDSNDAWCMQPLLAANPAVSTDFSGIWYDTADTGWGITFVSFPGNGGDGLAAQIYYPDASGRGRWGLMLAERYVAGDSHPVYQVSNGYCRSCAAPGEQQLVQIGTITVNLQTGNGGQDSRVSFDLTYPGAEGGRFVRTNAAISLGSEAQF